MYRRILVPLDGSELAESVLPHIITISKVCSVEEIILFRAYEPPVILADYPSDLRPGWDDHVRQQNARSQHQIRFYLDEAKKKFSIAGLTENKFKLTTALSSGKPSERIVGYAIENFIDLIIMASHGRSGITRWAFGSTAERVLRASPVPVLVVKPQNLRKAIPDVDPEAEN